jgi:hypothetical protein
MPERSSRNLVRSKIPTDDQNNGGFGESKQNLPTRPSCPLRGKRHWLLTRRGSARSPRISPNLVTPDVISVDIHQSDEAALSSGRNRTCTIKTPAIELPLVLLAGDLSPTLPVRRRLDEPRFQKYAVWITAPG